MERIVYCQDDLYVNDLNFVKAEDTTKVVNGKELQVGFVSKQEPSFVQEMVSHTKAYFNVSLHDTAVLLHPQHYSIYPLSRPRCSQYESFVQYYYYAGNSSQKV